MPTKSTRKLAGKPTSQARGSVKGGRYPGSRKAAAPRRRSRRTLPRLRLPDLPLASMSLERKLDLLGIGLALVGLLTLLALLSASNGWLSGSWLALLGKAFGWGMYLFPLGLGLLGLWLILRRFERLPGISAERVIGLVLLFANLVVWLHFFSFPQEGLFYALAEKGQGGGYLGAAVLSGLYKGLGWAGAGVALVAWLLIALALALDLSVPDLFAWLGPLAGGLRAGWGGLWSRLWARRRTRGPLPNGRAASGGATLRAAGGPVSSDGPGAVAVGPTGPAYFPPAPGGAAHPAWVLPPVADILESGGEAPVDDEIDRQRARIIEETLASFGAPAKVVEINRGPTITQFGVEPGFLESRNGQMRVRVSKIAALADDLALALSAKRIRIQAPVPSKGYVGIEVPNEVIALVALRDVLESEAFQRIKSPLAFALGQDVAGDPAAADLAAMPHLLIAGTTGAGKSVCVNALICCLLLNNTPDDLRMIMVDPKRVELTGYNGIPHLLAPVVVELERVVGALQWVTREMDARYQKLAQAGARNINDYNARVAAHTEPHAHSDALKHSDARLPHLVVVIDELADLMMLAPDDTERTITRLAQLARATGIHLVIATQRPSVDVVTGLIKANFPARIAFAVASGVDSRVILDQPGAERLLGRGDMLFQAPDAAAPVRLQGVFVSDAEIQLLVNYWRGFNPSEAIPMAASGVPDAPPPGVPLKQLPIWEDMAPEEDVDPLYAEAVDLVRRQGRASISMLQRRLRIGYTRAARLIERMQEKGVVGPALPGTQGMEVLDYGPAAPPLDEQGD